MPKYAGFNPQELELYLSRRDRRILGIRETNVGPDYCFDDQAIMLSRAIQDVDPNLDHAFTPEAAEEAFE